MYALQLTEDFYGDRENPEVEFDKFYNLAVERLIEISDFKDKGGDVGPAISNAIVDLYMLAVISGVSIDQEVRDTFVTLGTINKSVKRFRELKEQRDSDDNSLGR